MYTIMKKTINKMVGRLSYDAPYVEIIGTDAESVLCSSGVTQDFEDGGVVGWFDEN